ncbi:MAG: insulinase family protein [Candidatus Aminicenantes bacterium]|nr:insulinase family protein [Candidatus Aminicenantes bacterium]
MMKYIGITLLIIGLIASVAGAAQVQKPSELKFPPLKYDPPNPKDFRTSFANSLSGYIQEDHELPIFNISALINFGGLYVTQDKLGLNEIMSEILIKGGTKTREGSTIEDRINFLGGSLSFRAGERTSTLSLSVLREDLDEGLDLFFDVLMNPAFREDALELARAGLIQRLRQANDQPGSVLSREYESLIYGGSHPLTWQPTRATYEGITAADLKTAHGAFFFPKNIILAASGDFDTSALKAKIDKLTAGWQNKKAAFPALSKKFPQPEPGVYFIQQKINQGYISLGHLGIEETNPDYPALQVMNFILGGGSFSSRITTKVRSDEGLSYNQGSRFTTRWGFPGTFSGYVQTKSSTVGYAISLIQAEFKRIRKEPVTDDEMDTAVNYYLESFSNVFESPQGTMSTFAELEMTGMPMDYYATYRDKIRAVTKAKVKEVANTYIHPDRMVIVIVGDFEPCNASGDQWPGPLDKLGKVHMVTLKDPLTGEVKQ